MRRAIIVVFGLILCFTFSRTLAALGSGWKLHLPNNESFLELETELGVSQQAMEKFNEITQILAKKQVQYKNKVDFVEYLYYYAHRRLLKEYQKYPSLSETLLDGKYDCLTATTVYSLLLSELDIPHDVVETNYHIYILVYPDTPQEILLESTDPKYGFITNPEDISIAKRHYVEDNNVVHETILQLDYSIERRLQRQEIIGLLYYNQSIKQLNQGNIKDARENAMHAVEFYTYERIFKLLEAIEKMQPIASL